MENNKKILLDCRNICKSFFGIQILWDVNMQVLEGEIHCLVGENGAGKSTLVKAICGLYKDYTGEIEVDGKVIEMTEAQRSREAGIFSVQQHRDLIPTMNAVENIFLGNFITKKNGTIDYKQMRAKAQEYLKQFEIDINLDVPVSQLKVSEQEIIAICKATASDGKLFLIDEASAPLDNFERTILYNLLRKLRNEGKGIIYISHHLEEIFEIGDRVTVLRNGRNVWTKYTKDTNRDDLISAMTGDKKLYNRDYEDVASERAGETPLFSFDHVNGNSLRDVSFNIYKGEVIGFAGLEGSGKSQVAELMFGLARPDTGEIRYRGEVADFSHPIDAIRNDIACVPTERKIQGLVCCRNVAENMMLAAINKKKSPFISRGWMNKNTQEKINSLSIKTSGINQVVEYLSGGNQQKVLVAKWMQTDFDILLCVEPTEGVDVGARADIYELLRQMAEQGKTIVVFSSDIDELLTLCDRIYTMTQGTIYQEYDAGKVEKTQILSDILTKQEEEVSA